MGKLLIVVGIICIVVGIFMTYGHRIPFLGKLPGDFSFDSENFKVYIPITTSILISVLLSLLFLLYNKLK